MPELRVAIRRMLDEAAPEAMHWTVVLDRALREGAVAPSPDARSQVQRALAAAAKAGEIEKTSTGTYRSRPA